MTSEEIKELVIQGESGTLGFKERVSSRRNLSVILSSFANSLGGTLFLGITNKGKIRGLENPDKVVADVNSIALNNVEIEPPIQLSTEIIKIHNKFIVTVEVPQSPKGPHAVQGTYYQRKGPYSCLMSSKQLKSKIEEVVSKSDNVLDALKYQIAQLIKQNENLYEQAKRAQSWKTKCVDLLLGAILGGIVSLILSVLI